MTLATMHPVSAPGRAGAVPTPAEEANARLDLVANGLEARGLAGALVYGDPRDHARLAYVSGLLPNVQFAVALVPADDEPTLFLAGLGIESIRLLTWIDRVEPLSALGAAVGALGGPVALVGASHIRTSARRLLPPELVEGHDDVVDAPMRRPSSAELALVRAAVELTDAAVDAVGAQLVAGATSSDALVAGRAYALASGARDVRILYSAEGSLRPLEGRVEKPSEPFAYYLGVQLDGYWAEAFRTPGTAAGGETAPHPVLDAEGCVVRLGLWRGGDRVDEPREPGLYSVRRATRCGDGVALTSKVVEVPA